MSANTSAVVTNCAILFAIVTCTASVAFWAHSAEGMISILLGFLIHRPWYVRYAR